MVLKLRFYCYESLHFFSQVRLLYRETNLAEAEYRVFASFLLRNTVCGGIWVCVCTKPTARALVDGLTSDNIHNIYVGISTKIFVVLSDM